METILKGYSKAILIALFSIAVLIVAFICLPQSTLAQTGTLGTEEPQVYFTYDKDGDNVDGNKLEADTYDVSIHLTGMSNTSVLEVTASYDTTKVTVADTPDSLLSDEVQGIESMGYVLGDGNIVFGFVSTNADCSALGDDVVIAKVEMTFAEDCDAEQYITVSPSPDLTFAQVNYADGYDNEYSLTPDADKDVNYVGTLYAMSCDVSPAFGHSVSGSLVIAINSNGDTSGAPVAGEYTVNVYSDANRTNLVATTKSAFDENANKNCFVIDGIDDGTYYVSISSRYALTRNDITLIVNGNDIVAAPIPMIACNFNGDEYVTGADAFTIYSESAKEKGADYCNLNGDEYVTGADAFIVYACSNDLDLNSITIQ